MTQPYPSFSNLLADLADGSKTSEHLVQECLDAIGARDPQLGAFLEVWPEEALAQARSIDIKRREGKALGPLAGVPIALKDNIHLSGKRTTCASKMLASFSAPFDATVVKHLKNAGAILLGKTNLDEFAMGSSTEHSAFQLTRNPHDPSRVPGGSSGGSAAAVAADMAPLSLGSSTGGSIRQPAAFCGVVGMKPTYGRVSRYGLVAFGSSLDQIGPMAKDVSGAAHLLQAISGHDSADATSAKLPVPNLIEAIKTFPARPKIGLPREFFDSGLDPEIRKCMDVLLTALEHYGAELKEVSLPASAYAIPAYYLLATAEASSNLARFDGARYGFRAKNPVDIQAMYTQSRSQGFGMEVKRRIMLGTYCLSSGYYEGYYLQAQKVRTQLIQEYQAAFAQVDVLLSPTTPYVAFPIGSKTNDPMDMYLSDIFTVTANLVGIPAISLPCGKNSANLPIGVQLLANHFQEAQLVSMAALCESLIA